MRTRTIVYGIVLAMLASICSGCKPEPDQLVQPAYWPAQDWRTSTPEEQGMDSSLILGMLEEIENKKLNVHSIVVLRHGYVVTEIYYPPYQEDMKHPVFSITKSVTSAMVGKAIQQGYIKGIQQNVLEFFPDIATEAKDPKLGELTLEHLLSMSAGYSTNTMPNLFGKDARFDTIRHILTYNSVLWTPGTTFFYDSGSPHLLSAILQESSGLTLQAFTEQELFQPLGITKFSWDSDPAGITTGATGLMLRPMDMAKIGYLYLHYGKWNGEQLLPKEWVEVSTSKYMETKGLMNAAEDDGYGYLWWIDSFDGYSAHGFGGQFIFVLPGLDMVIVFTGGLPDSLFPVPNQLVQSYLIPAARSKILEPNPQAFRSLVDRIQVIQSGDVTHSTLPEKAMEISGKTFRITQEPQVGFYDAVTLTFLGDGIYQNETQWPGDQRFVVTGNLNQGFHLNKVIFPGPPAQELLLPLRGYWQDEVTFIEQYMENLNASIDLITEKYTFAGDKVTIDIRSSMDLFSMQLTGEVLK